jgi:hypothetical protein
MKRERGIVALQWPGIGRLKAAREAIGRGEEICIELRADEHYALYMRFHPGAARASVGPMASFGGGEILERLGELRDLAELARPKGAVRRARYRLRLLSPESIPELLPLESGDREPR